MKISLFGRDITENILQHQQFLESNVTLSSLVKTKLRITANVTNEEIRMGTES